MLTIEQWKHYQVFGDRRLEVEDNDFYNFRDDLADPLYQHKATTELFQMEVHFQIIAVAIVKFMSTLSEEDNMVSVLVTASYT